MSPGPATRIARKIRNVIYHQALLVIFCIFVQMLVSIKQVALKGHDDVRRNMKSFLFLGANGAMVCYLPHIVPPTMELFREFRSCGNFPGLWGDPNVSSGLCRLEGCEQGRPPRSPGQEPGRTAAAEGTCPS